MLRGIPSRVEPCSNRYLTGKVKRAESVVVTFHQKRGRRPDGRPDVDGHHQVVVGVAGIALAYVVKIQQP